MVLSIGLDSIEIVRFKKWSSFSHAHLLKVFTHAELLYCLAIPVKSAERLAAHFAAKEACYKALSSAFPSFKYPFRKFCRLVEVKRQENGAPTLILSSSLREELKKNFHTLLSITHTTTTASAIVLVQKVPD